MIEGVKGSLIMLSWLESRDYGDGEEISSAVGVVEGEGDAWGWITSWSSFLPRQHPNAECVCVCVSIPLHIRGLSV